MKQNFWYFLPSELKKIPDSRRALQGIKGARAVPRGAVPLVRSTVMADVRQV